MTDHTSNPALTVNLHDAVVHEAHVGQSGVGHYFYAELVTENAPTGAKVGLFFATPAAVMAAAQELLALAAKANVAVAESDAA
jgi:hypothetical protein